ncbi:MAG TPA: tetratricopeptide repeat protein [Bryobacteraceae bacterium]|nr:tetratricopeptide repeat protein [Bryobacteraceae bacterium]
MLELITTRHQPRLSRLFSRLFATSSRLLLLPLLLPAQSLDPSADFQRATRLATAGRLDEAIALYERLAGAYPGNTAVLANLGIAEYKATHYQAAEGRFRALLRIEPESWVGRLFLGGSLLKQGNHAAALPFLEQAVAAQPADRNARTLLGQALMAGGRPKDAAIHLRAALERAPADESIRTQLVLALYDANDAPAGLRYAKEALDTHPASAEWYFLYGAGLLEAQQVEGAIAHLEKAVKLDPKHETAHAALGRAYLESGEPGKAIPHLKAALAPDPDGSRHYQLVRALQAAGRKEEAAAALREYQARRNSAPAR